jgi:hypothetical protein
MNFAVKVSFIDMVVGDNMSYQLLILHYGAKVLTQGWIRTLTLNEQQNLVFAATSKKQMKITDFYRK